MNVEAGANSNIGKIMEAARASKWSWPSILAAILAASAVGIAVLNGSGWPVILFILLGIYFLPAFIGRHKRDATAIFALNIFVGWTFLGWVAAFVWALKRDD